MIPNTPPFLRQLNMPTAEGTHRPKKEHGRRGLLCRTTQMRSVHLEDAAPGNLVILNTNAGAECAANT